MLVDRGGSSYCSSVSANPCVDRIPFTVTLGPCDPCPSGDLLDYAAVDGPGSARPVEFEARCSRGDAGAFIAYRLASSASGGAACDSRPVLGSSSFFFPLANPRPASSVGQGRVAYSGPGGRLWFGAELASITSIAFDRVPEGVASRGPLDTDVLVIGDGVVGEPNPTLGLSATPLSVPAVVAGNEPSWVLMGGQLRSLRGAASLTTGRALAVFTTQLQAPRSMVSAIATNGTTLAVLANGNQLLAAQVDDSPGSTALGLFEPKLATVNPIRSLAFARGRTDGGANLVDGYLISGPSLARVRAESPARWLLEDVPFPLTLAPKEVWFDGTRGRVGLSNGSIVALPSRLPIAAPLPASAEDFERVCAQDFALTTTGLHRLTVRPPVVLGQWEAVPLPAGFAPAGFSGGRLFSVPPSLYVFTRSGEAATLAVTPCPP